VWVRSEHPYRPLSLSVPQSLSLSCVSLKCSHLVCIWGCDPQNLSLHKHSEWVCFSPSIYISCRLHLWCLVYSVHIQSLWLTRLTAKMMPFFNCSFLLVVVIQGLFPPKVHHGCFCIFLLSYSVFCVSGELLVWGVVVKIELFSVDFGCEFISDLSGVLIFCFGSFPRSVRPNPPLLRGRASICLSASPTSRPTRAGINWSLMAFSSGSNNSLASGTVLWNNCPVAGNIKTKTLA